jgi:cytochrome P450
VAFDVVQEYSQLRFLSPIPLWISKWISPLEWLLVKNVRTLDEFAFGVVKARREEEDLESKLDVLSRFMCMKNPATGEDYTDKELRDIVLNFIIAGRDTTANSLSWSLYYIIKYPGVQEKLQKEIDSVLNGEVPTYDKIQKLEYTYAFYTEVLRLNPSVPKDNKECVEDCTLPDGNPMKAGDYLVYCPWQMGRSEKLWGKDALEFKPERFLEDKKPSPYKFAVFQAGPRTCLGQNMAYLESITFIAMLLQKYTIALKPGQNPTYRFTVTLPMVRNRDGYE